MDREELLADEDTTTPEHLLHRPRVSAASIGLPGNALVDLWLRPIQAPLALAGETADKALGEMTMPEFLAWVYVLSYAAMTGVVIGKIAGNLAEVALGRRRH